MAVTYSPMNPIEVLLHSLHLHRNLRWLICVNCGEMIWYRPCTIVSGHVLHRECNDALAIQQFKLAYAQAHKLHSQKTAGIIAI